MKELSQAIRNTFGMYQKVELDICKKKPIAKNTERAHEWAMKVFHEWLKAKKRDIFYCKPETNFRKDDVWFCNAPIGHNTLASKLTDMFVEAGLNAKGVQNHSL